MTTLIAEKRKPGIKAKKLRRDGYATGVLLGRNFKDSVPLQFQAKDALRFIKGNKEGAQVILEIGSEKTSAIVKNIDYDFMKRELLALDFQALVAGEKISTSIPVKLTNEELAQGIVEQELSEIHYKADPDNLLSPVEIDLSTLSPEVKALYVKDLHLTEKKKIDLITPEDTMIFHIADYVEAKEPESVEETAAAETE